MNLDLPELHNLWESTLGWSPSSVQQQQFQQLLEQIYELNQKVNLTRITDPEAFWEKHLWDSLWGVRPWLDAVAVEESMHWKAIDIGTGGGFPGIPVAIARPEWQMTLLDATSKKIACLKTLSETLPLTNVQTRCDRAETLGQDLRHRETYDLALIRAVGSSSTCAEYTLPLLKIGGTAVLYRGQWSTEEEQILHKALLQLGGEINEICIAVTPITNGQRHGVYLRKIEATSASYPRKSGLPAKYPLGTVSLRP
jgi:16S rRNA (guanine527-N7)-methyltransferase